MPFPLGNLQLECLNGSEPGCPDDWWNFKRVIRDFLWESSDGNTSVLVKAGRFIDGASIPPFLWPILGSPFGVWSMAAAIHDQKYKEGDDRGMSDYTMGAVAKETPAVKPWQRIAVILGLRFFGWYTWRKYRGTLPWSKGKHNDQIDSIDDRARRSDGQ